MELCKRFVTLLTCPHGNLQVLAAMWDHLLLRTPGEIASTVCSSVMTLMQVCCRHGVTCTCVCVCTRALTVSGPQTRM